MSVIRRIILGLSLGVFALVSLQAEAEGIRFWAALPEPDQTEMVELVDRYNHQHASRSVDYRNFPSRQDLFMALEQGDLPDLALLDSTWIDRLKTKLYPAEDILARAGVMVKVVAKADTFQPVWESCVVDGKAYAIPFSAETAALVLNPAYFKKIPRIATVSQWQKAATTLGKNAVHVTPMVFPAGWGKPEFGELWTSFAIANSKSPFWRRFNHSGDHPLTLTDEAAALNLWWNWVNRSKLMRVPGFLVPDGFLHGATSIMLPREVEALHEKGVVEPLPKLRRPWSFLRVDALGFFNSGRAWEFANFLTDYPEMKAWSMKTPTVPVNKQVYLSPDYLRDMDSRRPWMRIYIAAISRHPRDLEFPEDRLEQVGETVLKTLSKDLKVEAGALKIHESLFGMVEPR